MEQVSMPPAEPIPSGNGWYWTGMKTLMVKIEDEDEEVHVDGEKGPIVNMEGGGWKFYRWDNVVKGTTAGQWLGSNPQQFYQMSATAKEVMVYIAAKRNRRLKERQGSFFPS
mmetsp:Transcript_110536/g.344579  ORF Transcript_110536/g.344579 Transcript_110536/m.344579 type:complete len:112 (-) Transcript_110536:44-379(-)